MADKLKELPKKLLEWWNKFTNKQRTIIISVIAGVVVALAILITILTAPQYELLATCDSTKEASEITDLLDGESLTYKVSDDGLTIQILKGELSDANLLLGANDIPTESYSIDNVLDGSFSTTEADKQKKYKLYLAGRMEEDLTANVAVKSANVQLSIPEDDGTLLADDEETYASIMLELEEGAELDADAASAMARFVAVGLGSETTNNVVIIDTEGDLLYSGEDSYSVAGSASTQLSAKQNAESLVKNEVKKVLLGTNEFDNVEVASNLSLDFSTTDQTEHTYTPADGQTQGVLSHEDIYASESTGGTTGVPGTDSNDETTYVVPDDTTSSDTVSEESRDYLPNEKITNTTIPAGLIQYDSSSISIAAISYKVVKQENAQDQGLLDGISWAEYQAANGDRTKMEVDQDLVNMVAKATGISTDNISIVAYEEPIFVDKEGLSVKAADVLQIALIIVILGLLVFVVLRSMKREKQEEPEEELSVENLLQSTPEEELENIEIGGKSETRKMIEKFVDENPEAAANLLRNWLNEDWG